MASTVPADYTLSIEDAARQLGVHADSVRRWADSGQIPFLRTPGGHRRFRAADIDDFAARLMQLAEPAEPT